jgi:hypothetical protein
VTDDVAAPDAADAEPDAEIDIEPTSESDAEPETESEPEAEPELDAEANAEPETEQDAEPEPDAEPEAESDAEPGVEGADERSSDRGARLPGMLARYIAAFVLVVASLASLGLGTLSLVGRGVDVSPTGLFWASIVLSLLATALALTALFSQARR